MRTSTSRTPQPPRPPRPRWFGHPALLLVLFCLIGLDAASMHRHALVHTVFPPHRTGPTIMTFASVHGTPDNFRIVWRDQHTPADDADFIASVGSASAFLNRTKGVLHATSVHGYFTPWYSMEGLDERDIALAVHHSALESDSEVADYLRNHFPQGMSLLAQGKLHSSRRLPMGYLRNAIFLALLATLLLCAVGGRADLWAHRISRAIGPPARDPNACPRCGYDATGLVVCPECGLELDR